MATRLFFMPEKNFCNKAKNSVISVISFLAFLALLAFPLYISMLTEIFLFARVNAGNANPILLALLAFPLYKSTRPGFLVRFLRFSETVEK